VDGAIEDGIGVGWLADEVVPGFDGELAGDQRRGAAMPFLDDLHEIAALASIEAVRTEGVEDQQVDFGECSEESGKAGHARSHGGEVIPYSSVVSIPVAREVCHRS